MLILCKRISTIFSSKCSIKRFTEGTETNNPFKIHSLFPFPPLSPSNPYNARLSLPYFPEVPSSPINPATESGESVRRTVPHPVWDTESGSDLPPLEKSHHTIRSNAIHVLARKSAVRADPLTKFLRGSWPPVIPLADTPTPGTVTQPRSTSCAVPSRAFPRHSRRTCVAPFVTREVVGPRRS